MKRKNSDKHPPLMPVPSLPQKVAWWILKHESLVFFAGRSYYLLCWLLDPSFDTCRLLLWKIQGYTLVSYPRLRHLWQLLNQVEHTNVPGIYVECGVWRGGSAAVIAFHAQQESPHRVVHLFDSWEGMPHPRKEDGDKARIFSQTKQSGALVSIHKTVSPLNDVRHLFFRKLNLTEKDIFFHKGWFQTTIPKEKKSLRTIALLRIDADWYDAVKFCLEELYDCVVAGGYIIFDDYYYWPGCKKAVDEFLATRHHHTPLQRIDSSGAWIQKC